MEEFRIDCLHQTEEELGVAKELRQNIFRLNHTMPDTEEYRELLHKVFPHLGENCRIETPFAGVRTAKREVRTQCDCHAGLSDDVGGWHYHR